MLAVRTGRRLGLMHHTISVVGGRVECIELHRVGAGVDEVVPSTGRHQDRRPRSDVGPHTVQLCFAAALLDPKELIQRMPQWTPQIRPPIDTANPATTPIRDDW